MSTRNPVVELIHAAIGVLALRERDHDGNLYARWLSPQEVEKRYARLSRAVDAADKMHARGGLYVITGGGQTLHTDDETTAKLTALGLALTMSPDEIRVTDSRTGEHVVVTKKGA